MNTAGTAEGTGSLGLATGMSRRRQQAGLLLAIIGVPVLTPRLSSYWVKLVTPVSLDLVKPLIEGLKNEMICHEDSIGALIPIERTPIREAIRLALTEPRPSSIKA